MKHPLDSVAPEIDSLTRMKHGLICTLLLLILGVIRPALGGQAIPWWEDFPTIIQVVDAKTAVETHATASLCGAADDPTWGIYGQRLRIASAAKNARDLQAAGLKALTWIEGFGTCGSYIAQMKRKPDGSWMKDPNDPQLTRVFKNHWNWQDFDYDRAGEIHWVGPHNYFADGEFARPWTRTHPQYGGPPMTYPDGRVSDGYKGFTGDPRNSWILDAGCAKDVLGRVSFEYGYNEAVNRIQRESLQPRGPLTGLVRVDDAPLGPPDPGFTPEEWKKLKKAGYAGSVDAGKDSACPIWIDYARASVRQALDTGIDGLWVDNYSPWDSFNAYPNLKAFGEWSVAGFRDYLRTHFSRKALTRMGVSEVKRFDIRPYLQARCREWGGQPEQLADARWRDRRWQDDPLWRAYLIYKRQKGTAALSTLYRAIKKEAAAAGKTDFLIMGNDIPLYSLGWVRGDLDMVSTELNWGWHLTSGPRGFMPPPHGNYAPVYKLAREHARSRFVNAWMYVPDEQMGKTNIARVLYYQALANHAMPMPFPGNRTAGNPAIDAEFFKFVRQAAPVFKDRLPVEEVGLYYSSSSQLMEMLPGGFLDHQRQPHSFAFWGWGTALTQLHVQWRAVPEWKLNADLLKTLRVLIIPNTEVFEKRDASVLVAWVRQGGLLVVTGNSGVRLGESGNFERVSQGSVLSAFITDSGTTNEQSRPFGKGRVVYLRNDPGYPYYLADQERGTMLKSFRHVFEMFSTFQGTLAVNAPEVPATVGLTLYHQDHGLFIDVNNTDIDLGKDTIANAAPIKFAVKLPRELRGRKLRVEILTPDSRARADIGQASEEEVAVRLDGVLVFASVHLEAEKSD